MKVKVGNDVYNRDDRGVLRRVNAKPMSKRRRRILGLGRKTPNQLKAGA
jgi:hypothetical protein